MKKILFPSFCLKSIVLGAVLLLNSCMTYPINTRSYEYLKSQNDRLYRGYVEVIATEEMFKEVIDKTNKKDFEGLYGITKKEAQNKSFLVLRIENSPGEAWRVMVLANKSLQLEKYDILDFYVGRFNEIALRNRTIIEVPTIYWLLGVETMSTVPYIPLDKHGKLLSIVCRAEEKGCSYNTSPLTQIGIGRQMKDENDYRGAKAESKYIKDIDMNIAEFLSMDTCFECQNDPEPTE